MLSYAVRYFGCDAGVVITASHNPAKYNGYKAYGSDGCQLNLEASNYVLSIMNKVDIFEGVKSTDFDTAVKEGKIRYIGDEVIESYLNEVQKCSVAGDIDLSDLNVIYTPLHGSGNKPVRAILKRIGINNVTIVPEQELPDGNFPTAPYPNPEIKQPFELALKLAENINPDLLLATDPDCDRVGIAVRYNGEYKLFSGNDVGALLLNYIIERRNATGTMPENPIAIKTIVTTELCKKIAEDNNVKLIDVLTGFKFIGEQIGLLESKGEEDRYIFGFEESYGCLGGTYARDKDAVYAAVLICEMAAYYKEKGMTLYEALLALYEKYGYYREGVKSLTMKGLEGMERIALIMKTFRENTPASLGGFKVVVAKDYKTQVFKNLVTGEESGSPLPVSDVLHYTLEDGTWVCIRPSGTEPKLKFYIGVKADSLQAAQDKVDVLDKDIDAKIAAI